MDDDDLSPLDLMDEVDEATLTLLYALKEELGALSTVVAELKSELCKDRVTTMTGRDGKTLTAISKVKD